MSLNNIVAITPVSGIASSFGGTISASEAVPTAVDVTFSTRKGGEITYRYSDPEAVAQILLGDDPAHYEGERQ
jgi:hypothetical protein